MVVELWNRSVSAQAFVVDRVVKLHTSSEHLCDSFIVVKVLERLSALDGGFDVNEYLTAIDQEAGLQIAIS